MSYHRIWKGGGSVHGKEKEKEKEVRIGKRLEALPIDHLVIPPPKISYLGGGFIKPQIMVKLNVHDSSYW